MAPPKNNPSKGGRGRFSPYSQEARVKSKSPEIKAEDNEEQATANPNLDVPALPQERPMVSVRAQRAQLQATIERYRTEAAEAAERMTEAERIMAELNGEIDMLNRVEANLRAEARAGDKAFNDMMIAADLANGRRRAAERTVEEQREEIEELNQALDTLIVERNALNEHVTRLDTRGNTHGGELLQAPENHHRQLDQAFREQHTALMAQIGVSEDLRGQVRERDDRLQEQAREIADLRARLEARPHTPQPPQPRPQAEQQADREESIDLYGATPPPPVAAPAPAAPVVAPLAVARRPQQRHRAPERRTQPARVCKSKVRSYKEPRG